MFFVPKVIGRYKKQKLVNRSIIFWAYSNIGDGVDRCRLSEMRQARYRTGGDGD